MARFSYQHKPYDTDTLYHYIKKIPGPMLVNTAPHTYKTCSNLFTTP